MVMYNKTIFINKNGSREFNIKKFIQCKDSWWCSIDVSMKYVRYNMVC